MEINLGDREVHPDKPATPAWFPPAFQGELQRRMAEMETRSEPLRFTYFFYDPYLSYEGVHSIDGRTPVPNYLDQQRHRLGIILCTNSSGYYRQKYETGDEKMIFKYATESRVCFQSPWVTVAIPIIPDSNSDLMPDACSEGWRTPWSERSDAGGFLFYGCFSFRQVFVCFSWILLSIECGEHCESPDLGWHRRWLDPRYDHASFRRGAGS